MTAKKHTFSNDDILTLIAHWEAGLTAKEIAIAMERPFNNIRNKIKVLQSKKMIDPRSRDETVRKEYLLEAYKAYPELPVDVIDGLADLLGKDIKHLESTLPGLVEAYIAQDGYCFYLNDRIKLTFDGSLSQADLSTDDHQMPVLICRAVSLVRRGMGHSSFVNMCKYIAQRF